MASPFKIYLNDIIHIVKYLSVIKIGLEKSTTAFRIFLSYLGTV
jgi:hypothetical protein